MDILVSHNHKESPFAFVVMGDIYEQLAEYVKQATGEISFLGCVYKVKNTFIIYKLIFPKQKCSSSETDMDMNSVQEITTEMAQHNTEDFNNIRAWIHSHANMGVFWSGTDTGTQTSLGFQYIVSIVVNKKGEILSKLTVNGDFDFEIDHIPTYVRYNPSVDTEAIKAEIEEKVSTSTYTYYGKGYKKTKPHKQTKYKKGMVWDTVSREWYDPEEIFDDTPTYDTGEKYVMFQNLYHQDAVANYLGIDKEQTKLIYELCEVYFAFKPHEMTEENLAIAKLEMNFSIFYHFSYRCQLKEFYHRLLAVITLIMKNETEYNDYKDTCAEYIKIIDSWEVKNVK